MSILEEVESGRPLDEALDARFASSAVPAAYKPLVYEIAAGVVRWELYLDWVIAHFARKTVKKDVRCLLRMTLYQAFFMHKAVYHVVGEAVEYAKKTKGQGTANFVNAVLRGAIRERDRMTLPSDPVARLSVQYSFPHWLVKRWHVRFGPEVTAKLLDLLNRSPEFGLRVDTRRTTNTEAKRRLADLGIDPRDGRFIEGAIVVDRLGPLLNDRLLTDHLVHIQDEASQIPALALAPSAGTIVLDACAGQGTKTGQMREMAPEARIVAMDLSREKVRTIRSTDCLLLASALRNPFKETTFDSILLDAPCSSLGIVRKHPEIKWRRMEGDIKRHGTTQREMIRALSASLKHGGRLVYSVCSFEPEETIDVVEHVTAEGVLVPEKIAPVSSADSWFLSLPQETAMDGFFVAGFRKP